MSTLARESATVRIKYALDRVLALVALVVFSPILALIGLWILIETGKPILFEQRRVGKGGREFDMLKFRTMVEGPNPSPDPHGHLADDPRITRSGRFLRGTSLDELPQLLNVLRGEMSLVGPRGDIVEQVANYTESERRRLGVRPGITGWAQINGRDSIPWPKRFELDLWYIDNWSLALDAKIIARTVVQIFRERPEPIVDEMNIEREGTERHMSQRPAVVFGLLWAGLALARSLGRSGVRVTGVAYERNDFGLRSRHLARRIAATADRDELLLAALREAAHDGRPVLFPERDESVHVVLRHWDEIRELADVPLPDDAGIVERLRRKDLLRAEAARADVPVPATVTPEHEDDIRTSDLRPPFLIKPVTGQEFAYAFGEKLFLAETVDEAVTAWRRAEEHGFETVVQELIPGSQEKIYSLFTYIGRDGVPLANVVGRKVRQGPLRFGTSAVFLVDYDERVLELGLRLLQTSGYRGFAQVEFAYDARDDTFQALEVNTRLPMWAGVAMSRYFDLARIAYDDLCGKPAPAPRTFRDDVAWVYFAKDAFVSLQMLRRRDLGLRDLLAPYVRRKKVRSVLSVDDPLPALAAMNYLRSKLEA